MIGQVPLVVFFFFRCGAPVLGSLLRFESPHIMSKAWGCGGSRPLKNPNQITPIVRWLIGPRPWILPPLFFGIWQRVAAPIPPRLVLFSSMLRRRVSSQGPMQPSMARVAARFRLSFGMSSSHEFGDPSFRIASSHPRPSCGRLSRSAARPSGPPQWFPIRFFVLVVWPRSFLSPGLLAAFIPSSGPPFSSLPAWYSWCRSGIRVRTLVARTLA